MRHPLHLIVAAFFTGSGVGHFKAPDFFEAVVPDWVADPQLANKVSGAAEIALGLGMIPASTRRASGWGLLALLALVFPANIDMALHDVALIKGPDGRWARRPGEEQGPRNWIRLPFQLLFALVVWRAAGLGASTGRRTQAVD